MSNIKVIRESERAWRALVDPPGEIPSRGDETEAFTSSDGRFTTGSGAANPTRGRSNGPTTRSP